MKDAGPLRASAAAKLAAGRIPAAIRHAHDYLQAMGAPAPVVVHVLRDPAQATRARGVRELRVLDEPAVAPRVRLTSGLRQHGYWSEPYQPPPLRVLAMTGAVAIAPNLILAADGTLLDDNIGFSNSELCDHMPPDFNGIVAGGGRLLLAVRHRDVARVTEPALYLPAPANYAAWLFGSLPRLVAYAEYDNLPILLHGEVANYHRDSLHAMGIAPERLRIHGAHVRIECQELYYCTTSYLHHAPSAAGVRYVRERVLANSGAGDASSSRIYLARRHASDRPLLNEAEVIAQFERHGFHAIDPEQHSFEAQVRHVAGAQILAGPYGANLANMLFARHAHKLLILATKHQPEFARLASALGIDVWHTVPQAVQLREGRTLSESMGFNANLDDLERALQACLA